MTLIVQKYGGSSVENITCIERVAKHIAHCRKNLKQDLVIAISAMGDQTDDLLNLAYTISPYPPQRELDMLLSAGERISMALLSIALQKLGIPALSLTGSQCGILTDGVHGNARIKEILGARIKDGIAKGQVVIVAGFQGVDPVTKEITTLGRGGTDLTAVALAAALNAQSCQLFKDVVGVLTGHPKICAGAHLLREISWREMEQLSWCGAQIVHPRALAVAEKFGVTIEVGATFDDFKIGTRIRGTPMMERASITAITEKRDLCYVRMMPLGRGSRIFTDVIRWLWEKGEAPTIQEFDHISGESSFAVTIGAKILDSFRQNFSSEVASLEVTESLASVSLIGSGFWLAPEILADFEEIARNFDVRKIAQQNLSITALVKSSEMEDLVRGLHAHFLANEG